MGSGAGLADAAAVRRAGGGSPRAGHRPAAGGRAGAGRLRGRARRRGASAEPGHGRGGPALLDERTLVKTWAARGTLHLLPADQAAAHLVLCSAARYWEKGSWQRASGATPADVEAIAAAAADALSGGAALTREELTRTVLDRTGAEHLAELLGSGWGMLLKPLAWWGVLCYGPPQGNRVTFTSPARWLPGWTGLPAVEDAARTVIHAYLGAHGPATPDAFDNWLMRKQNRKKDLKAWFAAAEDGLATVEVEGEPMFVLEEHKDELMETRPTDSVRLLGAFDQYVLGAGTSATYLVPAEHRSKVSRAAGWISPVVLYRGRVAGVWDAKNGDLAVTAFEDIPAGPLKDETNRLKPLLS
ncbi:winged helix DNA-binding domain-containing protein [Actinomadura madurae]|uniref:winged helix DNA-binding domain-containing protein n=1 Tax=Actinomadura madurae TaxID=1993 RepID=UPI0020D252BB|nr:winged helix DNA-binding domain-containing protein [Actinomadura madurae]MCP9949454.1 winged helix DNA-binding domain-containing protein [Actinomadura madurae]MCP9966207.1 winged helix DNA-binding domain-containing protein [Actinomadura madurae]